MEAEIRWIEIFMIILQIISQQRHLQVEDIYTIEVMCTRRGNEIIILIFRGIKIIELRNILFIANNIISINYEFSIDLFIL